MVWNRIKKAFDRGGVKLKIDAPRAFKWQDPMLPVAVQLTNTTDEDRVVVNVGFEIAEDTSSQRSNDGDRKRSGPAKTILTFDEPVEVRLAPGASETVEVEIPLSMSGALDGAEGEIPGWVATAATALSAFQNMSRNDKYYKVSAAHTVEGYKPSVRKGKRIRHLRPGEFQTGAWTFDFG